MLLHFLVLGVFLDILLEVIKDGLVVCVSFLVLALHESLDVVIHIGLDYHVESLTALRATCLFI